MITLTKTLFLNDKDTEKVEVDILTYFFFLLISIFKLGLCLQWTGLEMFQTQPYRISFFLHKTILEPVQNGFKLIQN